MKADKFTHDKFVKHTDWLSNREFLVETLEIFYSIVNRYIQIGQLANSKWDSLIGQSLLVTVGTDRFDWL